MTRIKFPPKSPCTICLNSCKSDDSLQCKHCRYFFHYSCLKISKKRFHKLKTKKNFICSLCCDMNECSICETPCSSVSRQATHCIKCKKTFCIKCTNLPIAEFKSLRNSAHSFVCKDCNCFENCNICSKPCINWPNYDQYIMCAHCSRSYHFSCCKLNRRQFFRRRSDIQKEPFYCQPCIKDSLPFVNVPKTKFNEISSSKTTEPTSLSPKHISSCELCLECNPDCENCTTCTDLYRVCDKCIDCNIDDFETFNSLLNQKGSSEISIIHFNIRSLLKHKPEIEQLLYSLHTPPDIICLSETKINDRTNLQDLYIEGYTLFENSSKSSFGGSAIYVSDTLSCKKRSDLEINIPGEVETSFIELQTKPSTQNESTFIASVYRHPHENHDFFQALSERVNRIGEKSQIMILGDTNIDVSQNTNITKKYKNLILCLNMRNLIQNHHTRPKSNGETLIDHFLTNVTCNKVKTGILQYDISDHVPIYGIVDLAANRQKTNLLSRKKTSSVNHYPSL